ncbi:ribonuclease H1 isoform X2 [Copidosoma floridanum]|nr:ribonuclease H1 isoform X2 [Copidosoma floridanum]XP_014212648.1 ribonuclease H1 isoform X2 [Copidosoma floridanum]
MSYYAVAKGRSPGIYRQWDECKDQVDKFSGAVFKKFNTREDAEEFIQQRSGVSSSYPGTSTSGYKSSMQCFPQKTRKFDKSYGLLASTSSKRLMSSSSDSDNASENVYQRKKKFRSESLSTTSNAKQFTVDENGYTEVYTDGACSSNGRGNAKAGIGVWFSDNNSYNVSQAVTGRPTNNMAEIQAVTIAAQQAQRAGIKKLKINTDSQFLISCITKWMPKWKKTGWQTSSNKPVINKQELIEMEKALAPLKVSWNHVRGHVGIHGNEMADKLARDGSEHYRKT